MIKEKATELGRLIGQSDEYKALRRAHDRVREEDALRQKMDQLTELAQTIEQMAAQGAEPAPDQVQQYNSLLGEIQGHAEYQGVVAAQSSFDKLMVKVNEEILEGIRTGSASPIITLS